SAGSTAQPLVRITRKAIDTPVGKRHLGHAGTVRAIHEAEDLLAVCELRQFLRRREAAVSAQWVGEVHYAGPRSDSRFKGVEYLHFGGRHREFHFLDH